MVETGEAADRGEGAYAELHHERYGREKMRGEGGAMLAEWVGRVVVGLVTCQGGRGRGEASLPSIPSTVLSGEVMRWRSALSVGKSKPNK